MNYTVLLSIHLLGVILLFSTYITAFSMKTFGEGARDRSILEHAYRSINRIDRVVTPISIVLIVVSGVWLALRAGWPILGTDWILWSLILWGATAVIFVAGPLRIQHKLERVLPSPDFSWEDYRRLARRWTFWAGLSFALTLGVLFLMIQK